eukprot:1972100-Prymnesium_polylepis.1
MHPSPAQRPPSLPRPRPPHHRLRRRRGGGGKTGGPCTAAAQPPEIDRRAAAKAEAPHTRQAPVQGGRGRYENGHTRSSSNSGKKNPK